MKPNVRTGAGHMDWEEVHRRLAQATVAMDESSRLSGERARDVMDERARALATVPALAPTAAEVLTVTLFDLSGMPYAIETQYVRRVVPLRDYTVVPGAPDFLLGIVNLRGDILAVLDLRKFLGVAAPGLTEHSRVIVLGDEQDEFGILADAVHEVVLLRIGEVHEAPGSIMGVGREYLRGVTSEAVTVLDGAVLLRDSRLFIDQSDEAGG